MDHREFWARAFLSSKSWNADGMASDKSRAHHAAEMANAALSEYQARFRAAPARPYSTEARLKLELEHLARLERTRGPDCAAAIEARAEIARLEQLIMANR